MAMPALAPEERPVDEDLEVEAPATPVSVAAESALVVDVPEGPADVLDAFGSVSLALVAEAVFEEPPVLVADMP